MSSKSKRRITRKVTIVVLVMIFVCACGGTPQDTAAAPEEETQGAKMVINVTSAAFEEGGAIPPRFTCDGLDISPPLSWGSPPDGARSLALIADDPDAPSGTFVHWVLYNLPSNTMRLPEDVPKQETLPSGAAQGLNGAGKIGYMGPCPPSGTHRYFFKVYALDAELDLEPGATGEDLVSVMEGHVLAEGRLMGTYRSR